MVYLLQMVIFHGYVSHNQMVTCFFAAYPTVIHDLATICIGAAKSTTPISRQVMSPEGFKLIKTMKATVPGR